jgi:hypothetical protein
MNNRSIGGWTGNYGVGSGRSADKPKDEGGELYIVVGFKVPKW